MGYTTEFEGEFRFDRPLNPEHFAFLVKFSETRRMKRNAERTALRADPVRVAAGLPVGIEGGWFVGALGDLGQEEADDILDWNRPPHGQPGLWCHWVPSEDGTALLWDESEKFTMYVEWLAYLIQQFLEPWGYVLDGVVDYQGEELQDYGRIYVVRNVVRVREQEEPRNEELKARFESSEEEE